MNEVEEIKARLDIVDVVGGYLELKRAGRTYKANCPFHHERTPSFIVSPDRQSWHCFGACGTGGDVITFVMKREGVEFPEALRMLAERAGVKLQERRVSQEQDQRKERLYAANEAAARYFRDVLLENPAGKQALEYLEGRGVDRPAIETFLLGYSLPGWEDLRDYLRKYGFTDEEMLRAALVSEGERGLHDRFHGRLMFAIKDPKGRVIGFGARALDDSMPKYINTAQTALFDKGGTLYALDRAQAAIRSEGRAVIVEGYMDALAAHQHGFENVVAQMGTALTERQVRLLKKLAPEIVLALDADAAGSEAMVRGHEVVREAAAEPDRAVPVVSWRGLVGYQEAASVNLRVAVLPQGCDPDEVIREDGESWRRLIAEARPVLDFRLEASAVAHDLEDPRGRSRLVQEFLPLLTAITDPVVRAHYLQRLSRLSLTSEEELASMLNRGKRGSRATERVAGEPAPWRQRDSKEEFLLSLLFRYPELRPEGIDTAETLLWESENRQILGAWKENPEIEAVKAALPPELGEHLARLLSRRVPDFDSKQAREALLDCRGRLERRALALEKQATGALLATREEELGTHTDGGEGSEERVKELVTLQLRDMETGLRLHGRERSNGS